ncbi:hypothetical protein [Paenibacillus ginsengarvi]|uniref:hypothetical protein n=1 Tax=Paenibacillus ginsengarvi TaxID=400777 RepID=UPI00131512DF|nr:hypothetical protein [Paenibacillus ginsengarvi]
MENNDIQIKIKASYEQGDVCEFDWGEAKLTIDGVLRTYQMADFTTAYGKGS